MTNWYKSYLLFSVIKSCQTLQPRGLQHARLRCPPLSPGAKVLSIEPVMLSNHLSLCHPFSSRLQSFLSSGSFPMSWLSTSGGQSDGASASVLPVNIQGWFPLELTGLISLQSSGLSRDFSSTTVRKHQFFGTQPSLWFIHDYWKNHSFDHTDLCQQSDVSAF